MRYSIRNSPPLKRFSSSVYDAERFLKSFAACDVNSRNSMFDEGISSGVLSSHHLKEALSNMEGGTICALKLRKMAMTRKDKVLNNSLRDFLQVAFSHDALEFRRVTFEESHGVMLERVAEKDSVLTKIRTLRELKRRLGNGRRCYALLHPQLPDDPVAFIHVALTQDLATGIQYLDRHCSAHDTPRCAMFYSVNSPHAALGGLDMASRIIKLAAADVARDFPSIDTFCTLSPMPGFTAWLAKVVSGDLSVEVPESLLRPLSERCSNDTSEVLRHVHSIVSTDHSWHKDMNTRKQFRPLLEWLGRSYLVDQKSQDMPYDPVARFHTRNGASIHRLNWIGNDSIIGMSRSAGLMVNYMYDLQKLESRARSFPQVHVHEDFWHTSGSGDA